MSAVLRRYRRRLSQSLVSFLWPKEREILLKRWRGVTLRNITNVKSFSEVTIKTVTQVKVRAIVYNLSTCLLKSERDTPLHALSPRLREREVNPLRIAGLRSIKHYCKYHEFQCYGRNFCCKSSVQCTMAFRLRTMHLIKCSWATALWWHFWSNPEPDWEATSQALDSSY